MGNKKKKSDTQNKSKIRAVPTEVDGIAFKSKLEAYCYIQLKENNLKAKYEGRTFIVLKSFKYRGDKVQKISYTPDFVGKDFIIECKGWANESFPLRWKLFKYMLYTKKLDYDVYLPHTPVEVDKVISKIKLKQENVSTRGIKKQVQRYKQLLTNLV
jgi:hypothetical protein